MVSRIAFLFFGLIGKLNNFNSGKKVLIFRIWQNFLNRTRVEVLTLCIDRLGQNLACFEFSAKIYRKIAFVRKEQKQCALLKRAFHYQFICIFFIFRESEKMNAKTLRLKQKQCTRRLYRADSGGGGGGWTPLSQGFDPQPTQRVPSLSYFEISIFG